MTEFEAAVRKYTQELEGWSTADKCWFLADSVLALNAKLSVEIGVFAGRSHLSLGMGHRHQRNGLSWGFDPWKADACLEGKNEKTNDAWWSTLDLPYIYKLYVEKVVQHNLLEHCYWARLHSAQAVKLFANDSIDIIHVDSNHSEEVSCKEVNLWSPKVRAGGIWVSDDIDWPTMEKSQRMLVEKGFVKMDGVGDGKWCAYTKSK